MEDLTKKEKKAFKLLSLRFLKRTPERQYEKQANELKDHEKTVKIAIKQA